MDFNSFIGKTDIEIQKYIKHPEVFDKERISVKDDIDFFTSTYVIRSNMTGNIFVVRFIYDVESNELDEQYVMLDKEDYIKLWDFINMC